MSPDAAFSLSSSYPYYNNNYNYGYNSTYNYTYGYNSTYNYNYGYNSTYNSTYNNSYSYPTYNEQVEPQVYQPTPAELAMQKYAKWIIKNYDANNNAELDFAEA